jgi:hypothetical protein
MFNFVNFKVTTVLSRGRCFDIATKLLIAFSAYILGKRLFYIATTDGWSNRAAFFVDGAIAPGLPDFIFNEVVLSFFLVYIVIIGVRPVFFLIFIASSLAFFNRSPLILMLCALFFSPNISSRNKLLYGCLFFLGSLFILYLRIDNDIFDIEKLSLFFLNYPAIGIGRLFVTTASEDVNLFHVVSLLVKPFDAIFFTIDYIFNLAGEISAARFAGYELSTFRFIPFLDESFNAFGTIVFPFIYILGWFFGPIIFCLFLVGNYCMYWIALNSSSSAMRLTLMLLFSGILFSWTSPFIWVLPFFFPRKRKTKNRKEKKNVFLRKDDISAHALNPPISAGLVV